mmetsp:Transcript_7370/g.30522  ORF Transcript_7370/g.30522 Transcript_7370/m.30522 type:complete len:379 (+) Transcript_7370:613-1749(+)
MRCGSYSTGSIASTSSARAATKVWSEMIAYDLPGHLCAPEPKTSESTKPGSDGSAKMSSMKSKSAAFSQTLLMPSIEWTTRSPRCAATEWPPDVLKVASLVAILSVIGTGGLAERMLTQKCSTSFASYGCPRSRVSASGCDAKYATAKHTAEFVASCAAKAMSSMLTATSRSVKRTLVFDGPEKFFSSSTIQRPRKPNSASRRVSSTTFAVSDASLASSQTAQGNVARISRIHDVRSAMMRSPAAIARPRPNGRNGIGKERKPIVKVRTSSHALALAASSFSRKYLGQMLVRMVCASKPWDQTRTSTTIVLRRPWSSSSSSASATPAIVAAIHARCAAWSRAPRCCLRGSMARKVWYCARTVAWTSLGNTMRFCCVDV